MTGLCWWRQKGSLEWRLGYETEADGGYAYVRMGKYNGHVHGAPIYTRSEIETRPYTEHLRR